jgi:hypothetical protein
MIKNRVNLLLLKKERVALTKFAFIQMLERFASMKWLRNSCPVAYYLTIHFDMNSFSPSISVMLTQDSQDTMPV